LETKRSDFTQRVNEGDSVVGKVLIFNREPAGRTTLILVREALGF
jgi:hypothetical protein